MKQNPMRYFPFTAFAFAAIFALTGCGPPPNGTEAFYERHPEYATPPSYFENAPHYDDQSLDDRYPGPNN